MNDSKKKYLINIIRPIFSRVSIFIKPTALKIYSILLLIVLILVIYLDALITNSFEGKKWQLPARVYARPLEVYSGLKVTSDEFERELIDLGYQKIRSNLSGSYSRKDNTFIVNTRGHIFWDGEEPPRSVNLKFNDTELNQISYSDWRSIEILRLEPLEIGAIYPSHKEDRILVKIDEVPPLLIAALVATEDHRFYEHHGISISAIMRAAIKNIKSGGVVQGGSTITQQLVKNYYLTLDRSFSRKITEVIMSILLEFHYEKDEILEAYLNEVYLGQAGGKGIHGFGLASQHYFNRPLKELSVDRIATLIALVKGPSYYDPWRHPSRATSRRNLVLKNLVSHGLLINDDFNWAINQPLGLGKKSKSHYVFPAYMDLVKRQLREFYDNHDLTSNGLKIYTSFDPRIQREAENAILDGLRKFNDKRLQSAAVISHPKTGEVVALVGGRSPRFAGFNHALDARRSVGSTIKPFVYLTALSIPEKYNLATIIDDSEITIENHGKSWTPRNYDRKNHGKIPLVVAMANSYNQATVRLGNELGVSKVLDTLEKLGLSRRMSPLPSIFIGTNELTPWELTGLYQTIASGGYHSPLKSIRAVLDSNNVPLKRFQFELKSGLDPETATLITEALIQVGKQGSAKKARQQLGNDFIFAGKTGTSGKHRDSWFAGFTGDMLAVVWIGRDKDSTVKLTGSNGALPIWSNLISSASKQPLLVDIPQTVRYYWVDLSSGSLLEEGCYNAIKLPFISGTQPKNKTRCHY